MEGVREIARACLSVIPAVSEKTQIVVVAGGVCVAALKMISWLQTPEERAMWSAREGFENACNGANVKLAEYSSSLGPAEFEALVAVFIGFRADWGKTMLSHAGAKDLTALTADYIRAADEEKSFFTAYFQHDHNPTSFRAPS